METNDHQQATVENYPLSEYWANVFRLLVLLESGVGGNEDDLAEAKKHIATMASKSVPYVRLTDYGMSASEIEIMTKGLDFGDANTIEEIVWPHHEDVQKALELFKPFYERIQASL